MDGSEWHLVIAHLLCSPQFTHVSIYYMKIIWQLAIPVHVRAFRPVHSRLSPFFSNISKNLAYQQKTLRNLPILQFLFQNSCSWDSFSVPFLSFLTCDFSYIVEGFGLIWFVTNGGIFFFQSPHHLWSDFLARLTVVATVYSLYLVSRLCLCD